MRTLWKGGIQFGLVYIPIKIYSGVTSHNLDLDMLREGDQCPIKYLRVCEKDGKEVPWENIVKGYKKGDHYVVLNDEDFERAAVKNTKTLDIFQFVNVEDVPPRYFKKTYLIEPEKAAGKTFNLLRIAMEKSGLAGLCRFVLRNREKIGLLQSAEDHVYLLELYWHDDLRPLSDTKSPKTKVSKKELELADTLISQMKGEFKPESYKDVYQERLLKIIQKKGKTQKSEPAPEVEDIDMTEADELLEQLKASLAGLEEEV